MKCLDVLFTAPKWSRLIYMLENILYGENAIRKKAFEAINLWLSVFNRSFTEPSKAQTDEIKRLINVLEDVLPPGVKKEILFTLPN